MTNPALSRWLLPWLMLLTLCMGVLNWAKTAPPANLSLAAESLIAHARNALTHQGNIDFDNKDASGASVGAKGGTAAAGEAAAGAKAGSGLVDDLANFRKDLGLPPAGSAADKSTLAVIEVNGQKIYGINAHGQPVSGVNAISATHAEIDALNQIKQQGINVSGQNLTLYVDRTPCLACGPNGGIRSMVEQLGLKQLTVIGPDGPMIITPR
jgi:filamentous hemagglutinin